MFTPAKKMLGHNNLKTTLSYLHVTIRDLIKIESPIEDLDIKKIKNIPSQKANFKSLQFDFIIHKQSNSEHTLAADKHQQFLKACERYIGELKKQGKLLSAQPIDWKGN